MSKLYETDFYGWTQEQIQLLHDQQWSKLDVPNLIEEIESFGKQQRQELRNRLSILIGHLLKWEYQSACRSRSLPRRRTSCWQRFARSTELPGEKCGLAE